MSIENRISVSDYVNAAVQTVLDLHRTEPDGDVLVFVTGQAGIEENRTVLLHDLNVCDYAECEEVCRQLHDNGL